MRAECQLRQVAFAYGIFQHVALACLGVGPYESYGGGGLFAVSLVSAQDYSALAFRDFYRLDYYIAFIARSDRG